MAARADSQVAHVDPVTTTAATTRSPTATAFSLDSSNIFKTPCASEATFADAALSVSAWPAARRAPARTVQALSEGGTATGAAPARSAGPAAAAPGGQRRVTRRASRARARV